MTFCNMIGKFSISVDVISPSYKGNKLELHLQWFTCLAHILNTNGVIYLKVDISHLGGVHCLRTLICSWALKTEIYIEIFNFEPYLHVLEIGYIVMKVTRNLYLSNDI
jgi:hypothetical protein